MMRSISRCKPLRRLESQTRMETRWALYPSLKDSYWLSLNYGMQEAARRYGVDLKVLEAGGHSQLAT